MTDLVLIATFEARPETNAELESRLAEMVALSTSEPGCGRYELHADREVPLRYVLIEIWANEASWDAHMATAHVLALVADASRLTSTEIGIQKLRRL